MSTTTMLPLLLELSPLQPVKSSAPVQETLLKAESDMMGIKYNPLTQVTEDSKGVPRMTATDVVGDTVVVDPYGHHIETRHNDHLNYDLIDLVLI